MADAPAQAAAPTGNTSRKRPKAPAPEPAAHPLDAFAKAANASPPQAIMLMFWKDRFQNPGAHIEVTEADLQGFNECMGYLEVTPYIRIYRPPGLPEQPAVPAEGKRRAIPYRPAKPPKDYVVIQMVDKDGNAIVPIENNEADLARSKEHQSLRRIRETAPQLAAQLQADVQNNALSTDTILQAVTALKVLSA